LPDGKHPAAHTGQWQFNIGILDDEAAHPAQRAWRGCYEGALRSNQMKEQSMLQSSPMYAYIPATDLSRARRFYEQKLGFKPKQEIAGGVVYEFGAGTACFLYPTPNAGTSKASQAFWQVNDVEREVAELKARGIEFEDYDMDGEKSPSGVVTAGGAKAAWFKDSEGNIMAIIQDA
jgi:predicted enzyme related to lactoylglutathione lyase